MENRVERSLHILNITRRAFLWKFSLLPAVWVLVGGKSPKSGELDTIEILRLYLDQKCLPRKFWTDQGLGLDNDLRLLALRGNTLLTELRNYRFQENDGKVDDPKRIFEILNKRIDSDFRAGNLLQYNGWLLTETEAMLYATLSLSG